MNRQNDGSLQQSISAVKSANTLAVTLPELPGGAHVAEYQLMNGENKVVDAGALNFSTPELCRVSMPEYLTRQRGEVIELPITITNAPAGSRLEYRVESAANREIARGSADAAGVKAIRFKLHAPYTVLNRVFLNVVAGGKTIARSMGEFSLPPGKTDPTEVYGLIWIARFEMTKTLRDLGFDMFITNYPHDCSARGFFRNLVNCDAEAVPFGSGNILASHKDNLRYRGDKASDPVRTPCYSDPAHWAKVRRIIGDTARNQHYAYYNVRNHYLADEAFLGSTVCYSPHCLKEFRTWLEKSYGSLAALNASWGTSFARWDEVTPCLLKEIQTPDNLSRWLDHKMFMAEVYAREWVGKTGQYLREAAPVL